ncbi:phage tail/DNA circulation protein [Hafnia paralvei ATCC 29927]|uniref:DNA circularization N-terminal domain-containing protein n=1 Tax=Hafnia paralvei TaxID=546367 RepID=UPI0007E365BD|nr:DNA circularization N-terminal domain-containing protein [Hafnia paralvei]OAT41354.1 phage tail/DNA circulation protein [Hafnia paralvei ATCC 29927]
MTIVGSALARLTQGGGDSWEWGENLHPASFRGVPFAVTGGESQFGRRQAVHEYPMRDRVWVEDLGRGTRRITLQGFIVQGSRIYSASDVLTQRDSLIAACESKGSGTLVHPTLGELTVSIPDGGLKFREGLDQGRSFSFTLTCLEGGLKTFALTTASPAGSGLDQSWFSTVTTAAASVIAEVKGEILSVKHAATTIQNTLSFWSHFVSSTAEEATTLSSSLNSTLGNLRFGRDCNGTVGGTISGLTGKITPAVGTVNYSALVAEKNAQVVRARSETVAAVAALSVMRDINKVPDAVQSLMLTLTAAVPSVKDQLSLFESMMSDAAFDGTYYNDMTSQQVYAALMAYLKIMSASMFTRVAVSAAMTGTLAAQDLFKRGISALDSASLLASAHGNDDLWNSLESLRETFTQNMLSQGLGAGRVIWSFPSPLPALVMANRIWQSAEKGDALVISASPIHPAFMPLSVEMSDDTNG